MSYRFYQTAEGAFEPRELTLSALMVKTPHTLTPAHLVRDALHLMQAEGFRHVPIVEADSHDGSGRLLGLVTETDLLRNVLQGQHLTTDEHYHASLELALPLEQIMTRPVQSLPPEATVSAAVALMLEHRLRCVPVTDPEGRLLGLVTQTDLLSLLRHLLD